MFKNYKPIAATIGLGLSLVLHLVLFFPFTSSSESEETQKNRKPDRMLVKNMAAPKPEKEKSPAEKPKKQPKPEPKKPAKPEKKKPPEQQQKKQQKKPSPPEPKQENQKKSPSSSQVSKPEVSEDSNVSSGNSSNKPTKNSNLSAPPEQEGPPDIRIRYAQQRHVLDAVRTLNAPLIFQPFSGGSWEIKLDKQYNVKKVVPYNKKNIVVADQLPVMNTRGEYHKLYKNIRDQASSKTNSQSGDLFLVITKKLQGRLTQRLKQFLNSHENLSLNQIKRAKSRFARTPNGSIQVKIESAITTNGKVIK